jgi:hypothetical protein
MMYCSFGGSEICVWKKSVLECNPERAGQPDPMRRTVKMQQQRRLEHWLLSRHRLAEVANFGGSAGGLLFRMSRESDVV